MKIFVTALFTRYFGFLIVLLNFLNIFDTFATLHWVGNGIAEEANPLMDYLISESSFLFAATKIILVGLGTYLLYRYKSSRASWAALASCLIVYLWIMIIHLRIASDELSFLSQAW